MHKQYTDSWLLPIISPLLTEEQLDNIARSNHTGLWEGAVKLGFVSDGQVLEKLAKRSRLNTASLPLQVYPETTHRITESVARKYGVVPTGETSSVASFATCNPLDPDCEEALTFATGKRIRLELTTPMIVSESLDKLYSTKLNDVEIAISNVTGMDVKSANEVSHTDVTGPVIDLVNKVIEDGIAKRASDIHCEPTPDGLTIRFRIDGVLRNFYSLPHGVVLPFISRIKIMSNLDIANRMRPQGGRMRFGGDDKAGVDLRVSTLPASVGEKVVIRVLKDQSGANSLSTLNLPKDITAKLRRLIDIREGLILITGPTGSGKTTTLYAALQELVTRGLNIITVEDPVEYRLTGVVQVQVNERAGLTFASALRSILRQDPDVVLIGEVRDQETANIAIQAALTGHLVFATLHTLDACSSITRLVDLGIDPNKIAAALKGVVAQRLVRLLCNGCKVVSTEPLPVALWGAIPSGAAVMQATGCELCSSTGYLGRIAATELVQVDPRMQQLISGGAAIQPLTKHVRNMGTRSLRDVGNDYVLDGITTAEEVGRVLDSDYNDLSSNDEYHATSNELQQISDSTHYRNEEQIPYGVSDSANTHISDLSKELSTMPDQIRATATVIEVYLIDRSLNPWRILTLKRSSDEVRPNSIEVIHGKIEKGEPVENAAVREVSEETGLEVKELFSITVHNFYVPSLSRIETSMVFCALVDSKAEITLGKEHQSYEWLPFDTAKSRLSWPRSRQMLNEIEILMQDKSLDVLGDVIRAIPKSFG